MLPTINGKSFMDCTLEDFSEIIDDESYRESDQIDYKKTFAAFSLPREKKDLINKEKAEFRKDVCALANAQGGYLIYGIKEDGKGVPHEMVGISIKDNNTDKFENDIRNILQTVSPKPPHYDLRFVPFGENYLVVLYVHHDLYSPYVFIEDNQDYRIYRRRGNSAAVASYSEVRSMFNQSLVLEKEIERFRRERMEFYRSRASQNVSYKKFLLVHFIPDTFMDNSYNKPVFVLERSGARFSNIFTSFECYTRSQPMIEGLRFTSEDGNKECRLYNNGIAELMFTLTQHELKYVRQSQCYFPYGWAWEKIDDALSSYILEMRKYLETTRIFPCITVVGCKGVYTQVDDWLDYIGSIDRDDLLCMPVVFDDIGNDDLLKMDKQRFKLEYLLSLGVSTKKEINDLVKEVYGD